jgi:hypothetical protein
MIRIHARYAFQILCGIALSTGAAAANVIQELDEVFVIGSKLHTMQLEAIAAEDRFYERFNALNTRDEFDVRCQMEKATGTKVPQRQCRVRFLVEAGAVNGQEFHEGLIYGRGINAPLAVLNAQWLVRRDEYRQTARDLIEKDPELKALALEWVRLQQRFEHARKEHDRIGK